MDKKKIVLITCGTIVGLIVLAVIGLFLLGLLAAIFIPTMVPPTPDNDEYISRQLSKNLYKSFEVSCEAYNATEGKYPDKFSQFVYLNTHDDINEKFDMASNYIITPDSNSDLESNKLDVEFKTGYKVLYFLKPNTCDISVSSEGKEINLK